MLREGVPLTNNSICKRIQSWGDPAMLLEYSIIMTSSNTASKGEKWVWWNSFRWLTNLYTSIRSSLCLRQYKEHKLRCCNLALYGKCANSETNFVALCCIRSSLSMFLAKYKFQIKTLIYSKCWQMYILYSIWNDSFVR